MDEPRRVAAHTTHSGLPSSGHQGPDESPVLPEAASSLTRTEQRWPAPATAKTSVALHSPTKVSRPWRQVYRRTTEGVSLPAGATASPREPTSRPQWMEEAHPVAPASSPGRSPQPAPSGCGGTGEGGPQAIPQGPTYEVEVKSGVEVVGAGWGGSAGVPVELILVGLCAAAGGARCPSPALRSVKRVGSRQPSSGLEWETGGAAHGPLRVVIPTRMRARPARGQRARSGGGGGLLSGSVVPAAIA